MSKPRPDRSPRPLVKHCLVCEQPFTSAGGACSEKCRTQLPDLLSKGHTRSIEPRKDLDSRAARMVRRSRSPREEEIL